MPWITLLLGLTACMSVVAATVNAVDKRRAVLRRSGVRVRRVPERTLHLLDLAGGWPGGVLARRVFRHKQHARKRAFIWKTRVIVAIHAALWLGVAVLLLTR